MLIIWITYNLFVTFDSITFVSFGTFEASFVILLYTAPTRGWLLLGRSPVLATPHTYIIYVNEQAPRVQGISGHNLLLYACA